VRGRRAGALLAFAALGCPRTPPRVDFEGGVTPAPVAVDVPPADVPRFAVVTSAQVPGEGRTLTVGALTLTAEPAERFVSSLALPVVGAVAETWVYRVGVAGEPLDLLRVVVEGGALRREVIAGSAPSTPNCASASLRATSPRSAVVTARCATRVEARWISRGDAPRPRSVVVVEAAPPGAGEVTADVVADDGDGDGVDELRVVVRPADGPPAAPTARLVYFDRSGALSRDVAEPAQSLSESSAAAQQAARRRGPSAAAQALEAERGFAAVRRALCNDDGAARVTVDGVRGVACGEAGGVLDRARLRVAATLGLGDFPAAEQVARALAATPGQANAWAALEPAIRAATTTERGWRARPGPFVGMPLDASAPGRVGSLAFDLPLRPPAVMVRGLQGGRVDLATLAFAPGSAGTARDLLATVAGAGVAGVAARCDGVSLYLCDPAQPCEPLPASAASPAAGMTRWPVHAATAFDLTAACATNPEAMRVLGPPSTQVLGAVRDRALVSVEGRLWWVGAAQSTPVLLSQRLGAGFSPGGAVSVNGAWVVLPGLNGLWVRGATGWKLRPVEGLENRTAQLRDLIITDDGNVIAGLVGTQLFVVERRPAR
jgi:hypothetical protein